MTRVHGLILAISLLFAGAGAGQLVWTQLAQAPAPAGGELRRCRDLPAAGRADAACEAAWCEAHRRFLDHPAAR